MAQGGEFAFVLYSAAAAVGIIDGRANAISYGDRHHLDGADAAGHHGLALTAAARRAVARRRRGRRRPDRQRAGHRLRPLRPDRQPAAARARHRGLDHRQRHRDDPGGRPSSASRSITATARGSTSCAPPAPARRDAVLICVDKARRRRSHRRAGQGRVSAGSRCWRAPSTAATRCSSSRPASTTRCAKPSNRRWFSAARRWNRLALIPKTSLKRSKTSRRRDTDRFETQLAEGIRAGQRFLRGNIGTPIPTPLTTPRRAGQALNEETAGVLHKSETAD